jgi:release factor glutamine methyltransferase
MLAAAIRERGWYPGAEVLDVFTGSGVLAVIAARDGARDVTAVDLSRRAVLAARSNARLNGARVNVVRGDLFEPLNGDCFDVITANPPYLPAAEPGLPDKGIERAWDAGHDGRLLIDRLIEEAGPRLRPGGRVVFVHSSVNGEQETLDKLRAAGLTPEVLARHPGPLGPILSDRAPMMEERGLLEPGQRDEEILVVAGRRPSRPVT